MIKTIFTLFVVFGNIRRIVFLIKFFRTVVARDRTVYLLTVMGIL